jgi:hypothetical protein
LGGAVSGGCEYDTDIDSTEDTGCETPCRSNGLDPPEAMHAAAGQAMLQPAAALPDPQHPASPGADWAVAHIDRADAAASAGGTPAATASSNNTAMNGRMRITQAR